MRKFIFITIALLLVGCTAEKSNKMIDNRFYQASADEKGDVLQISVGHDNNFYIMRGTKEETEGTYEKIDEYENAYIFKYKDQSQVVVIDDENGFYFAYPDTTKVYRLEFVDSGFVKPTH